MYIVRHGETDGDSLGLAVGQMDMLLNKRGVSQARALARSLNRLHVSDIISSDLRRAVATAKIIATSSGLKVTTNILLRAASFGELEGRRIADLEAAGIWRRRRDEMYVFRPAGGESYLDLETRLVRFLDTVQGRDANLLIVTHVGVIRVLAMLGGYIGRCQIGDFKPAYCSIWKCQLAGGRLASFKAVVDEPQPASCSF